MVKIVSASIAAKAPGNSLHSFLLSRCSSTRHGGIIFEIYMHFMMHFHFLYMRSLPHLNCCHAPRFPFCTGIASALHTLVRWCSTTAVNRLRGWPAACRVKSEIHQKINKLLTRNLNRVLFVITECFKKYLSRVVWSRDAP